MFESLTEVNEPESLTRYDMLIGLGGPVAIGALAVIVGAIQWWLTHSEAAAGALLLFIGEFIYATIASVRLFSIAASGAVKLTSRGSRYAARSSFTSMSAIRFAASRYASAPGWNES